MELLARERGDRECSATATTIFEGSDFLGPENARSNSLNID